MSSSYQAVEQGIWSEDPFLNCGDETVQEELVFLTQSLEEAPSLWASCSALTVILTPLPGARMSMNVTSRFGSGEGHITKTLDVVSTGDYYELRESENGQPLLLLGWLSRPQMSCCIPPDAAAKSMWIEGILNVDLEELYRLDQNGSFVGSIAPGSTRIEICGVTVAATQGSCFDKLVVGYAMLTLPFDSLFDINAAANFALHHAYPPAVLTGVLSTASLWNTGIEWRKMSHERGESMYEFMFGERGCINKSLYGGVITHDLTQLKVFDFSDFIIMHTVVAYGVIDKGAILVDADVWTFSMIVTVFSIIYVGKEMAFGVLAWTHHFGHVSRLKIMRALPGSTLHGVAACARLVGNPILMTTILLGLMSNAFPPHRFGLNWESYLAVIVALLSLGSWYTFAIIVPHLLFLGRVDWPARSVDLMFDLVECNVRGEAPTHRKRSSWSPKFHLYKFSVNILWKLAMLAAFSKYVPQSDEALSVWNDIGEKAARSTNMISHGLQNGKHIITHGFDFNEAFDQLQPRHVIVMAWVCGTSVAAVLELSMLIVAQCGLAYPGMSFSADVKDWMRGDARAARH